MLLVRISDGQVGFLVGVFSQPIMRQGRATMVHGELVQPPPTAGTLVSGCVAVGDQFVLAPIGEIRPIYELPEEGENGEPRPTPDQVIRIEGGPAPEPTAATGNPPQGPEDGEERSET